MYVGLHAPSLCTSTPFKINVYLTYKLNPLCVPFTTQQWTPTSICVWHYMHISGSAAVTLCSLRILQPCFLRPQYTKKSIAHHCVTFSSCITPFLSCVYEVALCNYKILILSEARSLLGLDWICMASLQASKTSFLLNVYSVAQALSAGQPQGSLVPRPIPSFSMLHAFQRATLKSWE